MNKKVIFMVLFLMVLMAVCFSVGVGIAYDCLCIRGLR